MFRVVSDSPSLRVLHWLLWSAYNSEHWTFSKCWIRARLDKKIFPDSDSLLMKWPNSSPNFKMSVTWMLLVFQIQTFLRKFETTEAWKPQSGELASSNNSRVKWMRDLMTSENRELKILLLVFRSSEMSSYSRTSCSPFRQHKIQTESFALMVFMNDSSWEKF